MVDETGPGAKQETGCLRLPVVRSRRRTARSARGVTRPLDGSGRRPYALAMAKARAAAGLLMYRWRSGRLEVLLVHHGGPFWRHKDAGAWSVPKGEIEPHEAPLDAARREFEEETGITPTEPYRDLGHIRQKAGKVVRCWAFTSESAGDIDVSAIRGNSFTMEWPPRSGAMREFPEVDRAAFFDLETARQKIIPAQAGLLDALAAIERADEPLPRP